MSFFRFPAPIHFFILIALAIIYLIGAFYYFGIPKLFELYKTDIVPLEDLIVKRQPWEISTNINNTEEIFFSTNTRNYNTEIQETINLAILESGLYLSFQPTNQYISSVFSVLRLSSFIFDTSIPSLLILWSKFDKYEIILDDTDDEVYRFYFSNPRVYILTVRTETVQQLETLATIQISELVPHS